MTTIETNRRFRAAALPAHSVFFTILALLADVLAICGAAIASGVAYHLFTYGDPGAPIRYLTVGLSTGLVFVLPFLIRGDYRISALVCYEDIIPGFVRKAVNEGDPHLLVNITNDAWFGDTTEPWEHLALAKFRAVEHHRYLVRSTNSGVSAIVDPVGRVTGNTGVFTVESLVGEVRMLEGWTLYRYLGDWPGWLSVAAVAWLAFLGAWVRSRLRRRTKWAKRPPSRSALTPPPPRTAARPASACSACSATAGANRWSCAATRCAPRWPWPAR